MQGDSHLVNFLLILVLMRFQFQKASAFLLFFSFILTHLLHINWPVVPTPGRQLDKQNNDEAGTSRPKWVLRLWLWVAIPGMSGLHLSVTHCFQDNHSQEAWEAPARPTSLTGSGCRGALYVSKKRHKNGKGERKNHGGTETRLCPVCPSLPARCCRKNIRHDVLLKIKFKKCWLRRLCSLFFNCVCCQPSRQTGQRAHGAAHFKNTETFLI